MAYDYPSTTSGVAPGLAHAAPARYTPDDTVDYGDIKWKYSEVRRLADYIRTELQRAESETSGFRDNLVLWRDFVDPRPYTKDFPWENASNVFLPIPRIVLDALKASVKQNIMRQKTLFVSEIGSAEACGITDAQIHDANMAASDFAEKLAREPDFLNLERVFDEWIEEILITGTGPIKLTIERDVRNVKTKGGRNITVTLRNGPRMYVVPVGTWVWPAGLWNSVQEMPWTGNWTVLSDGALELRRGENWKYLFVDEVLATGGAGTTAHGADYANRAEKVGITPAQQVGHKVYELYLFWKPKDSKPEDPYLDLMVTYSLEADAVLRISYPQADDGYKPYDVEVAGPRSGTIMGRGFIEPIVQPVQAINTAVNQTFDSQTLANAPVILYPEDSSAGSVLADGFAPGLALPYKESKDEIAVLKIPDPSDTSFTMIAFFQSIIERLTRIGASRLGDVQSTKRTPATLGLQVAQVGGELIDELIDRLRNTVGRLMSRAFLLYYQHDPGVFIRILGQERGTLLRTIVEKSYNERANLHELLRLKLTASSSTRSVELERQNAMAVAQMLFAWYEKAVALVQLYIQSQADPMVAATAKEILLSILKAAQEQMKRIVEMANTPDAASLVPDIAAMLEKTPPMPAPVPPEGGAPSTPEGAPSEPGQPQGPPGAGMMGMGM